MSSAHILVMNKYQECMLYHDLIDYLREYVQPTNHSQRLKHAKWVFSAVSGTTFDLTGII